MLKRSDRIILVNIDIALVWRFSMRGLMLSCAALCLSLVFLSSPADAKKHWTVTERQEALTSRIVKGEKSNELTKKEADKLRSRLSDINDHIEKAKTKNGGQLSYKDQGKAEKQLNSVSIDLEKYELQKRVIK